MRDVHCKGSPTASNLIHYSHYNDKKNARAGVNAAAAKSGQSATIIA